jgi:hypothetical protein
MPYTINTVDNFRKEAKKLKKKYASLGKELETLGQTLSENHTLGTALGNDCYKIRLAIASKSKGKSGGGRVITCVYAHTETVYLLSIYDKSEKENITETELEAYLNEIDWEEEDNEEEPNME